MVDMASEKASVENKSADMAKQLASLSHRFPAAAALGLGPVFTELDKWCNEWAELEMAKQQERREQERVAEEERLRKAEEARLAAEAEAKRMAKEAYEAKMREIQAKREEEARRVKEAQRIQQRLKQISPCPAGFRWSKVGGGWRCGGGSPAGVSEPAATSLRRGSRRRRRRRRLRLSGERGSEAAAVVFASPRREIKTAGSGGAFV